MQGLTRYGYREVIGGFFEFPTENAKRILPSHIEPVELHHGTSIFAMNVFDFDQSMVGPYQEAVMAVIVAPLVKPGEKLPKSAFYPYLVATTTRAAREHAIERWHLPHWPTDIEVEASRREDAAAAMRAIARLPGDRRRAVILRFVDEMSTPEVADVLGRSEGAVRVLIHRALRSVARDMGEPRR